MKKILALAVCVVMTVCVFTGCLFQKNAQTVLSVGDAKMSEDEFEFYLYASKIQLLQDNQMASADDAAVKDFLKAKNGDKTNLDLVYEDAVDKAFDVLVQYNKAIEKGLEATEAEEKEFNEQLELLYTQNGGIESVKQQLDDMGVTVEGFKEYNFRYVVIEKLYNSLVESGELAVDDEEIKKYFEENVLSKDYIKAQHILFTTVDNSTMMPLEEEEIASKKKLAEDTLKKIKAGEDFTALMNELSEDPGLQSSPSGYVFTKGEMVEPFEQAAFELGDNEVSGIVESDYGYHIIKRIPLNKDNIDEQEKDSIISELQAQKSQKIAEEWKKEAKLSKKESVLKKITENLIK